MIVQSCDRNVELAAFVTVESPTANSGWFRDYFYTQTRTEAERLDIRRYSKAAALPVLYRGPCLPPQQVDLQAESLTAQEISFPDISAFTSIDACDVDDRRVTPQGQLVSSVSARYQETRNFAMMGLLESVGKTLHYDGLNVLKYGRYPLYSRDGLLDTLDYVRAPELANINLTGTVEDWGQKCSNPFKTVDSIVQSMARYGAVAGVIDIIYGSTAWEMIEAHQERDEIKTHIASPLVPVLGGDSALFLAYSDVQFKGLTNAGGIRHWVSNAQIYNPVTKLVEDAIAPGEILIVSKDAYEGRQVFRTVSVDGAETVDVNSPIPGFIYEGVKPNDDPTCRSTRSYLQVHPLTVPRNVNSAVLVRVTADNTKVCVPCEICPPVVPVVVTL